MAIKLGPNSRLRDATSEESGKSFALVGAESFRQAQAEFDRLTRYQQEIVELAMRNNPALSLAETLAELNAFGL